MNLVLSCGCIFIQSLLVCALYCGAFSWINKKLDTLNSINDQITNEHTIFSPSHYILI